MPIDIDKNEQTRKFNLCLLAAEKGDIDAKAELGWMYWEGNGVSSNIEKALECFQYASDKNNPIGQAGLSNLYCIGKGVAKNLVKALSLAETSARQNNAYGQAMLGYMYLFGVGVFENIKEGRELVEASVKQNYSGGYQVAGYMYEFGKGVDKDYLKAIECYHKAAVTGKRTAQFRLGYLYKEGYEIEKDDVLAVKWFKQSAEQGYEEAQFYLGCAYRDGQGIPKDDFKAVEWFQKAADQGQMYAQYNLGYMYQHGLGVNKDNTVALEWYKKAATQGVEAAINAIKNSNLDIVKNFTYANLEVSTKHNLNYSYTPNTIQIVEGSSTIHTYTKTVSYTLIIKYQGSIEIGDRIIIKDDIPNPRIWENRRIVDGCIECMCLPKTTCEAIEFTFCCLASCVIPVLGPIIVAGRFAERHAAVIQKQIDSEATDEERKFWARQIIPKLLEADAMVDARIKEKEKREKEHNDSMLKMFEKFQQQSMSSNVVDFSDSSSSFVESKRLRPSALVIN